MKTNYEDDYYLAWTSDIHKYLFVSEKCKRINCSRAQEQDCDDIKNCPTVGM
jgi:hypothetical protein